MKLPIFETEFEFTKSLKDLVGIEGDQVAELIEKLDADQLTDLVDACSRGDADEVRKIIGGEMEGKEESGSDEEFSPLLSPKEKLKAQAKKKQRKAQDNNELGEDTDTVHTFNIGDTVLVDGEEATVKIPSAPGDTVGVMIDGELKMVDKSKVNLAEGVLGMSGMPGLKPHGDPDLQRIRELAGLGRDENSYDAPEPAEFPEEPDAMAHDDMGAADEFGDTLHGGMEAPGADIPALPAPTASPMSAMPSTASMAPPMPGAMDGEEDDSVALDNAISEIEGLIPGVRISEYKTLVARLKALVSMAESAGKAALTESQKRRMAENAASEKPKATPKGFGRGKYVEDKISPKDGEKKPETKKDGDEDVTRKTLLDYLKETDGLETLGMNRQDALRAIQNRLGPSASPQQANQAFTAMFTSGHIKQQNGRFMMPSTDDETFRTQVAQTGPANTGNASTQSAPTDDQGQGNMGSQGQTQQTGNNQGGNNPAYQGAK